MLSKVWKFGFTSIDKVNRDLLGNQFYNTNKYYNELIKIDNDFRQQFNLLRQQYVPGLAEAEIKQNELEQKLEDEGTNIELNRCKKSLKKYKQAKCDDEYNRCKELIGKLEIKIKEEKTLYLLKEQSKVVSNLKKEYKKLENKIEEENILKSACENFGFSVEDYNPKNGKLGPNSGKRKEIDSNYYELIKNSLVLSDFQKKRIELEKSKGDKIKRLYHEYDCLTPNVKTELEKAVKQAKTMSKEPLKTKRFDGSGKVSLQISNGGVLAKDLFEGKFKQLLISFNNDKYNYEQDDRWKTRKGRRCAEANLSFKIGTGKSSQRINGKVIIHRKVPADVLVKYASIQAEKTGPTIKYSLLLHLESNHFNNIIDQTGNITERRTQEGVIALDVGWREEKNGSLRVGCIGDINHQKIISIPKKIVNRFDKANDIRSIRDKLFDTAKNVFSELLKTISDSELKKEGEYIYKTKSPRKLVKLIGNYRKITDTTYLWKEWKKDREITKNKYKNLLLPKQEMDEWFKSKNINDEVELSWLYLEWWYRQNRHLYTYESNLREKFLKSRKEKYRILARKYANTGKKLVIENFDKNKVSTQEKRLNKTVNRNRTIASTSELILVLRNAFLDQNIRKMPPENTSRVCNKCGYNISSNSDYEQGKVKYICEKCKSEWDRDKNAVINMSKYGNENWNDRGKMREA